ncbi:MAG: T9SS type A sorting domain-containing protein [bacterium]
MTSKINLILMMILIFCCYHCSSTSNIPTQLDVELIPLDNCGTIFKDDPWAKKDSTQNYPNPFGPVTELRFKVGKCDSLKVYLINNEGAKCWLVLNDFLESGDYKLNFSFIEKSGIYVAKIFFSDHVVTKKLLIVK